jgi:hypothetical protein
MTGREFAKLARKHLLPHLPGYALKDGTLYALPVDHLFRSMNFYASAFSRERFTISCSVAPLYVPESAHAVLPGLGDRLPVLAGRGDRWWEWKIGDEHAETKMMKSILRLARVTGVPFLERFRRPQDVAAAIFADPQCASDPHATEARAYSLVLAGEHDLAMQTLEHLRLITIEDDERAAWWADQWGHNETPEEDWVITVGRRGDRVQKILTKSQRKAVELLEAWSAEQLAGLRLPKTTE